MAKLWKVKCSYDRIKQIAEKKHRVLTNYEKESLGKAAEQLKEYIEEQEDDG